MVLAGRRRRSCAYALVNTGREHDRRHARCSAEFDQYRRRSRVGSDVRLAGVKVGSVTGVRIDPQTFQAVLDVHRPRPT